MMDEDPLADILEPLPSKPKVPSSNNPVPGGGVRYEIMTCVQVTQYPNGQRFYKTLWVKEKGATTQINKKQSKAPAKKVEIAQDIEEESVL